MAAENVNAKKRRMVEEIANEAIFDKDGKNDGCVKGHCVFMETLKGKGALLYDDSEGSLERCFGTRAHDGCPAKQAVLKYASAYDIVLNKVIAQLKFAVAKQAGFDIFLEGARKVINYAMDESFERLFEEYMKRNIEMRDIFPRLVAGRDLVGIVYDVLGSSIKTDGNGRHYYERTPACPVSFVG